MDYTPTSRGYFGGTRQAPTKGKVLQEVVSGGARDAISRPQLT
jgi:hypothetical protein